MDPLIAASAISKGYVGNPLFHGASFAIEKGDKIGLIGANGCGKTTLFNIIRGEEPVDMGEIGWKEDIRFGVLDQYQVQDSDNTVLDHLMESPYLAELRGEISTIEALMADPAFYETDDYEQIMERYGQMQSEMARFDGEGFLDSATSVVEGLGFADINWDVKVKTLSGGERRKVELAKLIVASPNLDILLLDEPTNHLDIESIEWLEDYLVNYRSTVMIISHDRYFLDDTVNQMWEIEGKVLRGYWGDYTDYVEQKELLKKRQMHAYKNYRNSVKKQQDAIQTLKRRNRFDAQIKSKLKRLSHMTKVEDPVIKEKSFKFSFNEVKKAGRFVARGQEVSKSYGKNEVFANADFEVEVGEKVGVIGPNGSGKTTLVKMLVGEEKCTSGELKVSKVMKIGYYDQGHLSLSDDLDLIEEVMSVDPKLHEFDAKALLGRFLFRGDVVHHKVGRMSGGERARLSILKLIMSPANMLILDEPTNHLDIPSQLAIEGAINAYGGTALIVSHDRYFLDRVVDKIIQIKDGKVDCVAGSYTQFRQIVDKRERKHAPLEAKWYTVVSKYTDWTTGTKYRKGDKMKLHPEDLDEHRWALNTGKLVPDQG